MKNIILAFIGMVLYVFVGCVKNDDNFSTNDDLNGTWIDKESFALQFLDFYSDNQAKFGLYSKNFEQYDTFNYRIESNQIAIDFIGDNDSDETFHDLIKLNDETIEISDLTVIPENPSRIYYRCDIVTEKQNDTIAIGLNEIYYDFENGFRLQIDSITSDSRCPYGAECFWAGNADVRLDLIVGGNYHYQFILNTTYRKDTIIDSINYKLVQLFPYPVLSGNIDYQDYKIKIVTENQ